MTSGAVRLPRVPDLWADPEHAALAILDCALEISAAALAAAHFPELGGEPDPDERQQPGPSPEAALARRLLVRMHDLRTLLRDYRALAHDGNDHDEPGVDDIPF